MNTPFFQFLHKTITVVLTIGVTTIAYAQSPITMDGTTGAGTGRT